MSSRNAYLSADERRRALALSHALRLAENLAADGERSALAIERKMRESIARSGGVEVQYIALVADGTVTPVAAINGPTTVVLAAVVGRTRLIDNTLIG
jgi:pantoate--beta-alanine ligase